jgi:hypothetical protein
MALDILTALDVYRIKAFPLNSDGSFLISAEDPSGGGLQDAFEGFLFEGPISFDVNFGAARQIPIIAQGQVQDTFILPSIDPKTGVIRTAYDKLTLNQLLTGNLITTVGLAKVIDEATNREGQEQLVALWLQQLMAHDEAGLTVWRTDVIHRARLVPSPTGYSDTPMQKEYNIAMSRSTKRAWGEPYSVVTHGHTEAVKSQAITSNVWDLIIWEGNGEYTFHDLPIDKPAVTSSTAKVWDMTTGAARAGAWNTPTGATRFTPSVPLEANRQLAVTYEYEV